MTYKDEDEEQRRFSNSMKRMKPSKWESPLPKNRVLVFDEKSNFPTYVDVDVDGFLIGDTDEKYYVDEDDFITMNEVMKTFIALYDRDRPRISSERFITALDALKKFLTVEKEQGSFKIIKVDLSKMEEANTTHPSYWDIQRVPSAIGKLEHLQELNLARTAISRLPVEILLGCKHLKVLNLSLTKNLRTLDDEIVNLSELQELYLNDSAIQKLPDYSILSKLRNLEILDLSGTQRLRVGNEDVDSSSYLDRPPLDGSEIRLREGFDQMIIVDSGEEKLTSLRKLNLRHSQVLTWPLSQFAGFRKFFMDSPDRLRELDLSGARDLTSLPEAIGNISTLEQLHLAFANIASLPPTVSTFYDQLVGLKVFSLTSTPVLRKYPQEIKMAERCSEAPIPPLHGLVLGRRCPLLGCIGLQQYQVDSFLSHRKLSDALALNRARSRITTCANPETQEAKGVGNFRFSRALWPKILANRASFLFRPYEDCKDKSCDCQRSKKNIDALFCLLVNFGNEIIVQDNPKVSMKAFAGSENDDFVVIGDTNNKNEKDDDGDGDDGNDWMFLG